MVYVLVRVSQSDEGSLGELYNQFGDQICFTVERPPTGEHPCIPPGLYRWKTFQSPHNGDCWICTNPPEGRSMIEIHPANFMLELKGCIAPGLSFSRFTGVYEGESYNLPGVTNSKSTMKQLKRELPDEFDMEIKEEFN